MVDSRSRSPRRSPPPENRRGRSRSGSPDAQRRRDPSPERTAPAEASAPKGLSRSRSRSPPRGPKKSSNSKGFNWKKNQPSRDSEFGRGDRDYRDRENTFQPKRYRGGRDERDMERGRGDRARGANWDRETDNKFGGGKDRDGRNDSNKGRDKRNDKPAGRLDSSNTSSQPPARAAAAVQSQTYIIVTVNDRLGTKASIPCLPSDSVGDFKKMVAAHIGRQPHEIMLKRQGERPFKDILSLEDYGVSSGVQLDLELDTGD